MKFQLAEGEIFRIDNNGTWKVSTEVPEHFLYGNRKGVWSTVRGVVAVGGEFAYLAGEYIVTKTVTDGGGFGHGAHDVYPDGHHVYATHLEKGYMVDFYQSGCFNTTREQEVQVLGKGKLQWVRE